MTKAGLPQARAKSCLPQCCYPVGDSMFARLDTGAPLFDDGAMQHRSHTLVLGLFLSIACLTANLQAQTTRPASVSPIVEGFDWLLQDEQFEHTGLSWRVTEQPGWQLIAAASAQDISPGSLFCLAHAQQKALLTVKSQRLFMPLAPPTLRVDHGEQAGRFLKAMTKGAQTCLGSLQSFNAQVSVDARIFKMSFTRGVCHFALEFFLPLETTLQAVELWAGACSCLEPIDDIEASRARLLDASGRQFLAEKGATFFGREYRNFERNLTWHLPSWFAGRFLMKESAAEFDPQALCGATDEMSGLSCLLFPCLDTGSLADLHRKFCEKLAAKDEGREEKWLERSYRVSKLDRGPVTFWLATTMVAGKGYGFLVIADAAIAAQLDDAVSGFWREFQLGDLTSGWRRIDGGFENLYGRFIVRGEKNPADLYTVSTLNIFMLESLVLGRGVSLRNFYSSGGLRAAAVAKIVAMGKVSVPENTVWGGSLAQRFQFREGENVVLLVIRRRGHCVSVMEVRATTTEKAEQEMAKALAQVTLITALP